MVLPLLQLKEFDQYTTTHAINVAVLTMGLGEFLGLGAGTVRAFGLAGLLHDLGKIKDPGEILNKPGKLTAEERAIVECHPADGARMILEGEEPLDLAAAVAYEHHLHVDGRGYPALHYPRSAHHASRAGPRVRRLRCSAHQASLSRRVDLGGGTRLHREARRRRVRSRGGYGFRRR